MQCATCGKPVDAATLLMLVTAKVELGEERRTILAQLRNVLASMPLVTPAARAHFGRSGPSGKIAALLAVQASGDASEFPASILEMIYVRADLDLRIEIVRTLGMAGSEESVRVLSRIIEEEQDPTVLRAFGEKLGDGKVDEITYPSLEVMAGKPRAVAPGLEVKPPAMPIREVDARPPAMPPLDLKLPSNAVKEQDARAFGAFLDPRMPSHSPVGPDRPVSNPPPSLFGTYPPSNRELPAAPLEDIFGGEHDAFDTQLDRLIQPLPEDDAPTQQIQPLSVAQPTEQPVQAHQPTDAPRTTEPTEELTVLDSFMQIDEPKMPDVRVAVPLTAPPTRRSSRTWLRALVVAMVAALAGAAVTVGLLVALGKVGIMGAGAHLPGPGDRNEKTANVRPVKPHEKTGEKVPQVITEPAPPQGQDTPDQGPEAVELTYVAIASTEHRKYPASNMADGDSSTVWQESKGAWAIGPLLTFEFDRPVILVKIGIIVGYDAAGEGKGDPFEENNRLKEAILEFGDGTTQTVTFADERGLQFVQVAPHKAMKQLSLRIKDTYRGSRYNDNAIAEVQLWGY